MALLLLMIITNFKFNFISTVGKGSLSHCLLMFDGCVIRILILTETES